MTSYDLVWIVGGSVILVVGMVWALWPVYESWRERKAWLKKGR